MADLDRVHHDGSSQYVPNAAPALGETIEVRLRMPLSVQPEHVFLRMVADGEPRMIEATKDAHDECEQWWRAALPMRNPLTHYRWLLSGGNVGYQWIHAAGHSAFDVSDATDFAVVAHEATPAWAHRSIVYQVFPDRFARSAHEYTLPSWAIPREWSDAPTGRGRGVSQEYFGGDLWGVIDKLDHLQSLGITTLYFTPFFPAGSTHRYDANSFAHVDPLLGGDDALAALTTAAHERGMTVIGDLTLNHCGSKHEWFTGAHAGDGELRDFFTFDDSLEHGYECWFGVPSLPKFRYESDALRQRLITGDDSILRKWLRPPFSLDGWRVDVANMSGRLGASDLNHEVARMARGAVRAEGADKVLVAEHFHDAGPDLPGDGWHGTMNYTAFMRPVWSWLRDPDLDPSIAAPIGIPRYDGAAFVESMRSFAARMPWRSLVASWNVLGSHDTARIRTIVGSRERHLAAVALQMTLPGVPMLFSGDELGVEGSWGEDARKPYPWDTATEWDRALFETYATLTSLRTASDALADGGLRWVHAADDVLAFLRESETERLLVVVTRGPVAGLQLDLAAYGYSHAQSLYGFGATATQGVLPVDAPLAGAGIWRVS